MRPILAYWVGRLLYQYGHHIRNDVSPGINLSY
nr:MAG TPA: hypothetical protein [Caudoviricetes sp.]